MDVVQTAEDTGGQLGPERVPNAVFDLFLLALGIGGRDRDALLAIDRLAGSHVARDEQVLFALGNVDAGVLVRLERDGAGPALLAAQPGLAAPAATAPTTTGRSAAACRLAQNTFSS